MGKRDDSVIPVEPHPGYQIGKQYITGVLGSAITEQVHEYKQKLLGSILTIIDASIADTGQRKAIKDLINKEFYSVSITNAISVNYLMASLSRILRELRSQGSSEESARFDRFADLRDYNSYGNVLEKDLRGKELG